MKKFDLEAAKSGAEICTRDGHPARIICYDAKGLLPLVALIDLGKIEISQPYDNEGRVESSYPPQRNLRMVEKGGKK